MPKALSDRSDSVTRDWPAALRVRAALVWSLAIADRMELLGNVKGRERDGTVASVLLRLFKIVFASVTLFPDNEPVLQPHLAKIVTNSLKVSDLPCNARREGG